MMLILYEMHLHLQLLQGKMIATFAPVALFYSPHEFAISKCIILTLLILVCAGSEDVPPHGIFLKLISNVLWKQ